MTSDAQKAKGWLIPTPVTGYNMICVKLKIPDVREYRAAFMGAVYELTKWWNWQKSYAPGDTRAIQASSYLLESVNNMQFGECCDIEYQYTDCDLLQFRLSPTSEWETVADFENCFVSLSPGTPTRNRIVPTATNVPNLDLLPRLGQTAPLISTGVFNVYPNNTLTGTDFMWSLGGAQLFGARYGIDVIMCWHPFFRHFIVGQKTIIGGYQGMPPSDSMLEVNIDSTTLKGIKIKAIAGQTYNMFDNQKSDGTIYSGFDKLGKLFISTIATMPTGNPGNVATILMTLDNHEVWYYAGFIASVHTWKRLLTEADLPDELEVTYEDAPMGDSGSATIVDGTLNIIFPSPSVTPVPASEKFPYYPRAEYPPDEGEFKTWFLKCPANMGIQIPCFIGGMNVYITECEGQWTDEEFWPMFNASGECATTPPPVFPLMYCADGSSYDPVTCETAGGDYRDCTFVEGAVYMALMLAAYNETSTAWVLFGEAYNASFEGTVSAFTRAFFFPNATKFIGNTGEVIFKCTVANGFNPYETLIECGESDFATGLNGWHLKGAGEEPCVPSGEDCVAAGAWGVDKFTPTEKTIIIIGYIGSMTAIPTIAIDYTVTADGQQLYVVFWRHYPTGWNGGGYQYIDSSLGNHTHTNSSDFGTYDAVVVQIGPAGPEYSPPVYYLNKVTLNCS